VQNLFSSISSNLTNGIEQAIKRIPVSKPIPAPMPRRVMKSPMGTNQDGTAFFLSVITRMPNRSMADPRNSEKKAEAAVMKEA